jgi:acyl-CoA reductase-like NAD-dependent aldehyde dehydrogenase
MTSPYQSINPSTGQLLQRYEHLNGAQLDSALAQAHSCFQTWLGRTVKADAPVFG